MVRFCRSLGYAGLSEFKLKLAGSLSEGVPFIHRNVNADDKAGDVLVKVVDNAAAAFLKYRNDASGAAIEKAAKAMAQTQRKNKRLEFFGVGNSGFVAQDAQHKFFRLGFHTSAHSDGHLQIMSASLLKPGDCLVLISNSGRTRDLLDACEIAHKYRVTTVVITASGSPLAKAGQIHLAADHPESYEKIQPHGVSPLAFAHHRHPHHHRGLATRPGGVATATSPDENQPASKKIFMSTPVSTSNGLDIVIFGGAGDLSFRKLLPALYMAHAHDKLSDDTRILAVGRQAWDTAAYLKFIDEKSPGFIDASSFDRATWHGFLKALGVCESWMSAPPLPTPL